MKQYNYYFAFKNSSKETFRIDFENIFRIDITFLSMNNRGYIMEIN